MNKKKVLIILLILLAIILVVFFLSNNSQEATKVSSVSDANENITDNWDAYTSSQLGVTVSYPEDWQLDEFNYELDDYIELKSSEKIEYTDKLSNQIMQSPLNIITIRKDQFVDNSILDEWAEQRVNGDSIQNQEQENINGHLVLRQWVWNKQNSFAFSNINYYIQIGTDIISFRNTIMNEDPSSSQFINAEKLGDEIFGHFKLINTTLSGNENENTNMDTGLVNYDNSAWGFGLKYPNTWVLTENDIFEYGSEIIQLVRPDPDYPNSAHGGQDPNSAKVFVSFYKKNGRSFSYTIEGIIPSENNIIFQEDSIISGLTSSLIGDEGSLGSTLRMFIDFDNEQIVEIGGYYGNGEEQNSLINQIKDIQNSFEKI